MDSTTGSPLRLEFAAFSVKSMLMTSAGNGIDRSRRGGRLLPALALACMLASGIGPRSAVGTGNESGPAVGAGVDPEPAFDVDTTLSDAALAGRAGAAGG